MNIITICLGLLLLFIVGFLICSLVYFSALLIAAIFEAFENYRDS